jgi:hypothetical protein
LDGVARSAAASPRNLDNMKTTNGDPRYPIGPFTPPDSYTTAVRARFIHEVEEAPARMREAVSGLSREQLVTPYRDGGWTVAQVVHHVPDSHLNSYMRCKLALTEEEPTIKAYDEDRWAHLPDGSDPATVPGSLALLEALHGRWTKLLRSLSETDLARTLVHPENGRMTLDRVLAVYAWHGRHHVAHVTRLKERMGW